MAQYALNCNVIFGIGELENLGKEAKKMGAHKVCVGIDSFFVGGKYETKIKKLLKAEGIDCVFFGGFRPDPDCTDVDKCVELILKENCDFVIAFGGGSTIDGSKASAVTAKNGGKCWDYCTQKRTIENGKLPVIAVPTTSGTGSEVSHGAVISNRELEIKSGIAGPVVFPELAIVDPAITVDVPKWQTACTGFDVFAHAFESYMLSTSTPLSEATALEAIRLFGEHFINAVEDGSDLKAREGMSKASTLAGFNIALTDTCVGHLMGLPLSVYCHIPHGATLAAVLDHIADWIYPNEKERLAVVTRTLRPELGVLSIDEQAKMLGDVLRDFMVKAGIDKSLKDYGVKEEDIEKFLTYMDNTFGIGTPVWQPFARVATREDIRNIYKAAL